MRFTDLCPVHHESILALVELLPEWFDEKARTTGVPIDVQIHRGIVALKHQEVVGFVTFTSEYGTGRISWIAVRPGLQRKGIGRQLLENAVAVMAGAGMAEVTVETVGWSDPPYAPYAGTRAFYESAGFKLKRKGAMSQGAGYRWQMHILSKKIP